MSEETAEELKEAEANYAAVENEVADCKKAFLEAVAGRIPQKVSEFAKKIALSEPDVTKSLGSEGVRAMRRELEVLADDLAQDIAEAASSMEWPKPSIYSTGKFNDLHKTLFAYMYPKMGLFAQVFKRSGFNVHDDNARASQGLVLPQWFYAEDELTDQAKPLLAGISRLGKAEVALQKAKKTHDDSTVEELWGE